MKHSIRKTYQWYLIILLLLLNQAETGESFFRRNKKCFLYTGGLTLIAGISGLTISRFLGNKKNNNGKQDNPLSKKNIKKKLEGTSEIGSDNESDNGSETTGITGGISTRKNSVFSSGHPDRGGVEEEEKQNNSGSIVIPPMILEPITDFEHFTQEKNGPVIDCTKFNFNTLVEIWQPVIDQWDIKKDNVTWNPLQLVITMYRDFDAYTFRSYRATLAMLEHIALGKEAEFNRKINENDTKENDIPEEVFTTEVEKIELPLKAIGKFFFTAVFERAGELTLQGYSETNQKLLKEIMTMVKEANKSGKKVFMQNKSELLKEESKALQQFADLVINFLPMACVNIQGPKGFEYPSGIASTDSQGSFIPLCPIQKIIQYVQAPNEKSIFLNINCGDNVDKFGKAGRYSNAFNLLAHAVLAASTGKLSGEFNRKMQGSGKKFCLILAPGNHDIWHQPSEYYPAGQWEWSRIKEFFEKFYLVTDDENLTLQNNYFLNALITPKSYIINIPGTTMIRAQHSCCFEPVTFQSDWKTFQGEGMWSTWGRRIQSQEELEKIIEATVKKFNCAQNIVNFLQDYCNVNGSKNLAKNLFPVLNTTAAYWKEGEENDDDDDKKHRLITSIQNQTPSLWCDFTFQFKQSYYERNRGYYINNAVIPLLKYLFLTMNNLDKSSPNVIQFFGHSHSKDQEDLRITNYALQSPFYSLNMVIKDCKEKNIATYTRSMIAYYQNKPETPMSSYQGIRSYFLPISPRSIIESYRPNYYSDEQHIKFITKRRNTDINKVWYDNTLAYEFPYYLVFSKQSLHYASIKKMHETDYAHLFTLQDKEMPLTIIEDDNDKNIEAIDPQFYNKKL